MRARLQRDLKIERDRLEKQKKYARELRQVEEELDHERRRLKFAQQEDADKKQLEQNRAELRSLQETRSRAERMAQEEAQRGATKSTSTADENHAASQEPVSPEPDDPESARAEWNMMKRASNGTCKNAPLDTLMDMIGLESVKQEFLTIKSKIDTTVGQGVSLKKERFGCTLLGNPGTGMLRLTLFH